MSGNRTTQADGSLFDDAQRKLVTTYIYSRVGQVPEAVKALLTAYDTANGAAEILASHLASTAEALSAAQERVRELEAALDPDTLADARNDARFPG